MGDHVAVRTVTVQADALSRALRTLWVAIGIDACLAIGTGLADLMDKVDISTEVFWTSFGILILKSFLSALASYLVRLKVTPAAEKQREVLIPEDHIPVA